MTEDEQRQVSLDKFQTWWQENYLQSTLDEYKMAQKAWLHQNKKIFKNTNTFESNLQNVAKELTTAMNILFEMPIEVFADDASTFIMKYKNAHEKLKNKENS